MRQISTRQIVVSLYKLYSAIMIINQPIIQFCTALCHHGVWESWRERYMMCIRDSHTKLGISFKGSIWLHLHVYIFFDYHRGWGTERHLHFLFQVVYMMLALLVFQGGMYNYSMEKPNVGFLVTCMYSSMASFSLSKVVVYYHENSMMAARFLSAGDKSSCLLFKLSTEAMKTIK